MSSAEVVKLNLQAHKGKTDISKNAIHSTCFILLPQGRKDSDLRMIISFQLQVWPKGKSLDADTKAEWEKEQV